LPTLAHLAAQQVPEGIGFDVLLIDNASTDDTAATARRLWPADCRFPLRIAQEPNQGLSNARQRGMLEAGLEFINFIDDDNRVCPDWVHVVHDVLSNHPGLSACGGPSEAVIESQPLIGSATTRGITRSVSNTTRPET
jgi:glycosyltransferase involved in cell wall biosynthesis